MTPDHVLLLRLGARWPSPRRLWRHRRHRLFLKGYGMNLFEGLEQYVRESRPRFEEWLGRLVEIPTVSMDPARRNDMRRGAGGAGGCLTALGAQATIVETGGPPLVGGGGEGGPGGATPGGSNPLAARPAVEPG